MQQKIVFSSPGIEDKVVKIIEGYGTEVWRVDQLSEVKVLMEKCMVNRHTLLGVVVDENGLDLAHTVRQHAVNSMPRLPYLILSKAPGGGDLSLSSAVLLDGDSCHLASQIAYVLGTYDFYCQTAQTISKIVHRISGPINNIGGSLDLLSESELSKDDQEVLDIARKSMEKITSLLREGVPKL